MIVKTVIKSREVRTKDEEGKKDLQNNPNTINKMSAKACVCSVTKSERTYTSLITLSVKGINAPIKIHPVTELTQKQDL